MEPSNVPVVVIGQEHEHVVWDRLEKWRSSGERVILGLCGLPGVGKSTLAAWLHAGLPEGSARIVPMDGFHLANTQLVAQGLEHRKGAIDTFDAAGYAALVQRLAANEEDTVYAPSFDRSIEEPIAGSVAVERDVPIVITEGNYLLSDGARWRQARGAMKEVWFVDVDPSLRRERLIRRHIAFGKSPEDARSWVHRVDEQNALQVASQRHGADLRVHVQLDLDRPAVR